MMNLSDILNKSPKVSHISQSKKIEIHDQSKLAFKPLSIHKYLSLFNHISMFIYILGFKQL